MSQEIASCSAKAVYCLDVSPASSPCREILKDIQKFSPGTKVAFATHDPTDLSQVKKSWGGGHYAIDLDDCHRNISGSNKHEATLIQTCHDAGLDIVFLADGTTYENYVSELTKACERRKELVEVSKGQNSFHPGQKEYYTRIHGMYDQEYFSDVLRDYTRFYILGTEMGKNLLLWQPEVVFGKPIYTDAWMATGVLSGEYFKETNIRDREDVPMQDCLILPTASFDTHMHTKTRTCAREFSAITQGMIVPDKVPKWRGTWNVRLPAAGLSEFYINEVIGPTVTKGIVEDPVGPAYFEAEEGENNIRITKVYGENPNYVLDDPSTYSIIFYYEGIREGDLYRGDFWSPDPRGTQGRFLLQEAE